MMARENTMEPAGLFVEAWRLNRACWKPGTMFARAQMPRGRIFSLSV